LPDRLAEIKNVKDFGVKGNGTTDDTAAIQAAANHGGRVFFPPGTYRITQTIALPVGSFVSFYGANAVVIRGEVNGYVFDMGAGGSTDSGSVRFEGFHVSNFGFGERGGIRIKHGINCVVRDCGFEANRAVTFWSCQSSEVSNCTLRPGVLAPVERGTGPGRSTAGTVGIFTGAPADVETGSSVNMNINTVDINGFDRGIAIQGMASVRTARIEMCNIAIAVGSADNGGDYSSSALLEHLEFEANSIGVRIVGTATMTLVAIAGDDGFSGDVIDGGESRAGIIVTGGAKVVFSNVGVYGRYRDAGIKFEGVLDHSAFITTLVDPFFPSASSGAVPWRGVNLIGAG